jgi:hypothetical protein
MKKKSKIRKKEENRKQEAEERTRKCKRNQ